MRVTLEEAECDVVNTQFGYANIHLDVSLGLGTSTQRRYRNGQYCGSYDQWFGLVDTAE